MQTQYINEMLNIPELQILEILPMSAEEVHIKVTPVAQKQCCPTCRSDEFVILKGNNGGRKVRHLPAFEKKVYLLLSAIRMYGSKCEAGFVWDYLCVGPKKRYSNLFRERAAVQALGSTAAHSARMQQAPAQQHPDFLQLSPKAVVMDLARAYHTWISECFPNAIRIADHFHVHGYVIEAVQEVRKTVQNTLAPRAKARLKADHGLLNPKVESLPPQSKKCLEELLNYAPILRRVWEWKEAFTVWYDYSSSFEVAKLGFERWCKQGDQMDQKVR